MKVTFYFDLSCPFCWITSRWLLQVQNARQLEISWRPFSLALKNDAFAPNTTDSHAESHIAAHRVIRVIEAAVEQGAERGELYTAFGRQKHIMGEDYSNEIMSQVLHELQLPADLIEAADDSNYDAAIQQFLDAAVKVVGDDVGVPTIIFETEGGRETGYFGPVLQKLPSQSDSIKLWDGLVALATSPDFYELKRSRPAGDPETASTAVCLP